MLLDTADFTISQNPKSLANLVDIFWIDQPGERAMRFRVDLCLPSLKSVWATQRWTLTATVRTVNRLCPHFLRRCGSRQ
jgi:hypothetical protein